ncbi:tRNA adenosine deaminase-associated protein [Frankia sp. CNm7]|uniref:tRNA adenosine deaminase-associated protein n=1 Tax=Frankia nepalensis TaxID=1836974 RepID=A0A937UNE8_9ACTN|nr:tRNA adenosine deaminase-associated protein [Frankia nepalensis]MBL7499641.1 tRNA adenosine deaminase-associated protein [Frankia nepalensis]MBL7514444.1 tRNA adenosine deaminase-associated protein [Frankia nepalensis]MBL7523647.1 tRNA adenosine deaminase-associated protein [Frankia nepalensis]MBL7628018.1 tRNA adenosine deaminase-associated protein [Frankia nepalensis]
MSTKAVAIARDDEGWRAYDLDPTQLEDLDALTDVMRDLGDGLVVAFVEEDDEYLAIIRIDEDSTDPRVFLSDRRALATSDLAEALLADALPVPSPRRDEDDEEEAVSPNAQPIGDVDLLDDLGTPAEVLISLIAEEGMLPADVVAAVSERAGAGEILDEVRG